MPESQWIEELSKDYADIMSDRFEVCEQDLRIFDKHSLTSGEEIVVSNFWYDSEFDKIVTL